MKLLPIYKQWIQQRFEKVEQDIINYMLKYKHITIDHLAIYLQQRCRRLKEPRGKNYISMARQLLYRLEERGVIKKRPIEWALYTGGKRYDLELFFFTNCELIKTEYLKELQTIKTDLSTTLDSGELQFACMHQNCVERGRLVSWDQSYDQSFRCSTCKKSLQWAPHIVTQLQDRVTQLDEEIKMLVGRAT